ncbi:MAG: TetR/AcrR family transcriptional regulator [Planctomycetota bacterium]
MPRGRPKEFVREEALARALDAFWATGYVGTGLGDLTAAMGIGRQSLYDTFGDKRQLFMEALDAYCDGQEAQMRGLLEGAATPGAALARFFDAWPEFMGGSMSDGCLVINTIGEASSLGDEQITGTLREHMERFTVFVEELVQAAMDSGEVDVALGARQVASMVASAAHGVTVHARLEDTQRLAADVAESLKELLGLQERPGLRLPEGR